MKLGKAQGKKKAEGLMSFGFIILQPNCIIL